MSVENYKKFSNLSFDDFRSLADDDSLSCYEKIGFPNSYRENKESLIFDDIDSKVKLSDIVSQNVLDIGPGCSELPHMLIDICRKNDNQLILVDSGEMLKHLPDESYITKFDAYYPQCPSLFSAYAGKIDVILCYSVFHYIFVESNMWNFLDKSLELLAEGGRLLIGDIPNISMRRRFFSSESGKKFHREFTGKSSDPEVTFNVVDANTIDDSVIFSILMRARNAGFDAYVLPQSRSLPMSNRREDILITRP